MVIGTPSSFSINSTYFLQFSGSYYEQDPVLLAKKEYLKKRGADLVFFPYTQSTSSTKIKGLIEKKLL